MASPPPTSPHPTDTVDAHPAASADTAVASAAASSTTSPVREFACDTNSLSVVLSFLNMRNFLSATLVSRQWRSAGSARTAWPPPSSLESLLSSLQTLVQARDGHSTSHGDAIVRRPCIRPNGQGRFDLQVAHLMQSRTLSQASDIRFVTRDAALPSSVERELAQSALLSLAQLAHLDSLVVSTIPDYLDEVDLNLSAAGPADADGGQPVAVSPLGFAERWTAAMADKLRALVVDFGSESDGCLPASFQAHLPRLAHLRVLIVDGELPSDILWQLSPHLEYFQGDCREVAAIQTLRTMSVERALRGASLDLMGRRHLVAVLCGKDPPSPATAPNLPLTFQPTSLPAALTRLTLRGVNLSTSNLMSLARHLTQLRHLAVEWCPEADEAWDARLTFPHLLTLTLAFWVSLDFDSFSRPFLPICPKVRALTLTLARPDNPLCRPMRMSHAWLIELVTTNFPSVAQLAVRCWQAIDPNMIAPPKDADRPTADDDATVGDPPAAAAAAPPREARKDLEEEKGPFSGLADDCPQLEVLDLDMFPQVNLLHLLPTIRRLAHLHTLEVTCHTATQVVDVRFTLPPALYMVIASHPAFRTLRVRLSQRACDGPWVAHNPWQPNEPKELAPSMRELLARLPAAQRPKAEQRLASFRLHRYQRYSPVHTYGLESKESSSPLAWVWMAETKRPRA